MKYLPVVAVLVGLTAVPFAVKGAEPATCKPTDHPPVVPDQASRSPEDPLLSVFDNPYWASQRAAYERDVALSALAQRYKGDYTARGYDIASHLIRAKYNVALAEVSQVDKRDLKRGSSKMDEAARQLQDAFLLATGAHRSAIASLQDRFKQVTRVVSGCHGQSRRGNRNQYRALLSAIDGVTDSLLAQRRG